MDGTYWPIFVFCFAASGLNKKIPFKFSKIRHHALFGMHLAQFYRCVMQLRCIEGVVL